MYTAFATQINLAQVGRERIAEADLLAKVAQRIQSDIQTNLGPISPSNSLVPIPSGSGSTTGTGTASAGGTGTSSGTTSTGPVLFNIGVLGDQTSLVLTISKVPRELNDTSASIRTARRRTARSAICAASAIFWSAAARTPTGAWPGRRSPPSRIRTPSIILPTPTLSIRSNTSCRLPIRNR